MIDESKIPIERMTVRGIEHRLAVEKRSERSEIVRNMWKQGLSIQEIIRCTGFCYGTVKRYISEQFQPNNGYYGEQREGKLQPYRVEVMKLRGDGMKYREIYEHIKSKGYSGTINAIRGFVNKEYRIRKDMQFAVVNEDIELIDKKWIISLLYKPIEIALGITKVQLETIILANPIAG